MPTLQVIFMFFLLHPSIWSDFFLEALGSRSFWRDHGVPLQRPGTADQDGTGCQAW